MKKIKPWRRLVWTQVQEAAKLGWRKGGPSPQEKWALYILVGLLCIFYLMYWLS